MRKSLFPCLPFRTAASTVCILAIVGLAGSTTASGASGVNGWIENVGQWPDHVEFATRTGDAFADREGLTMRRVLGSRASSVRLTFGGGASGGVEGVDSLPGVLNFYLGDDRSRWRTGVRRFESIRWCDVEEGIDVVARETQAGIKYDVLLARAADLERLVVRCEGVDAIALGSDGHIETVGPERTSVVQRPGPAWQERAGGDRRLVAVTLVERGASSFGWSCPDCDPEAPLVIDPDLVWSTYLGASSSPGGSGDSASDCKVGPQGEVFATGQAGTPDFPTTPGAFQSVMPYPFSTAFLTCFETDGRLRWSSSFGTAQNSSKGPNSLAVDAAGHAYVVGDTSHGWPTTPGAFDEQFELPGGAAGYAMSFDGSVGTLRYSTYLHQSAQGGGTVAYAVVADASGAATVGGKTRPSFPTTPGSYDPIGSPPVDAFLCRLDPTGSSLLWSTFVGGTGDKDAIWELALDSDGAVLFAGQTGSRDLPTTPSSYQPEMGQHIGERSFAGRMSSDGSQLEWITYLSFGGAALGQEFVSGIGVDGAGNPVIVGTTNAPWFPTTAGAYQPLYSNGVSESVMGDAFLTRLDRDGTRAIYSTFFQSPWPEACSGVEVDASGVATVCGSSGGPIPTTPGSFDPTQNGDFDGFVARFDPSGSRLLYSTILGSASLDYLAGLGVTLSGRVSVAGQSCGPDYPTTPNAFAPTIAGGCDAVVTTFDLHPEGVRSIGTGTPSCQGVVRSGALRAPIAQQPGFGLWCSQAPPGARGWLVLATAALATPASTGGAELWLDRGAVRRVIPVTADRLGWCEAPVGLEHASAGTRLYAQFVFRNVPGCGAPSELSTSVPLEIVAH